MTQGTIIAIMMTTLQLFQVLASTETNHLHQIPSVGSNLYHVTLKPYFTPVDTTEKIRFLSSQNVNVPTPFGLTRPVIEVNKPIVVKEVVKEVPQKIIVEKKVPYVKPVTIIQRVPVTYQRMVPVTVEKKVPFPVLIPVQAYTSDENTTENITKKNLIDRKYRPFDDNEDYVKQFRLANARKGKSPKIITIKPLRAPGDFYGDKNNRNERYTRQKKHPKGSKNPSKYHYKCDVRYKGQNLGGEDPELDFQEAMHNVQHHAAIKDLKNPLEMSQYIDEQIHHHMMKAFGLDSPNKFKNLPSFGSSFENVDLTDKPQIQFPSNYNYDNQRPKDLLLNSGFNHPNFNGRNSGFGESVGGSYAKKEPIIYKGEAYSNLSGQDYPLGLDQLTPPKRVTYSRK